MKRLCPFLCLLLVCLMPASWASADEVLFSGLYDLQVIDDVFAQLETLYAAHGPWAITWPAEAKASAYTVRALLGGETIPYALPSTGHLPQAEAENLAQAAMAAALNGAIPYLDEYAFGSFLLDGGSGTPTWQIIILPQDGMQALPWYEVHLQAENGEVLKAEAIESYNYDPKGELLDFLLRQSRSAASWGPANLWTLEQKAMMDAFMSGHGVLPSAHGMPQPGDITPQEALTIAQDHLASAYPLSPDAVQSFIPDIAYNIYDPDAPHYYVGFFAVQGEYYAEDPIAHVEIDPQTGQVLQYVQYAHG